MEDREIKLVGFEEPTKLGDCVDVLDLLQAHKAYLNKELALLDKHFGEISDRLQNSLRQMNLTECAGSKKRVKVVEETKYNLKNKVDLVNYVIETDSYDLLYGMVNQRAARDRAEEGEDVPGLDTYVRTKLSILKR